MIVTAYGILAETNHNPKLFVRIADGGGLAFRLLAGGSDVELVAERERLAAAFGPTHACAARRRRLRPTRRGCHISP